jgi:tetratricopeptide (TPR) repeat protein
MKKGIILFVAIVIGFIVLLYSQLGMGMGRIQGTVLDENGKVLQGAKIKVQNETYKNFFLTTTSDKRGHWSLVGLASGPYTIVVTLRGYQERTDKIEYKEVTKQAFVWDVKLQLEGSAPKRPDNKNAESEALAALLKEGNQLYNEKHYGEAVAKFQQIMEKNPKVYQLNINMANCFREMKEYEKAIASYQVYLDRVAVDKGSLKEEPVTATVLSSMGEISLAQANPDKAKEYFKLAVDNFPTDEILAYNVAEIFFKQSQTDQAIDYFKIAIKIKETWPLPYLRLGYAYLNKGQYDLALDGLKKFLALAPDDPQAPTIRNLIPELEKLAKKRADQSFCLFSTRLNGSLILSAA